MVYSIWNRNKESRAERFSKRQQKNNYRDYIIALESGNEEAVRILTEEFFDKKDPKGTLQRLSDLGKAVLDHYDNKENPALEMLKPDQDGQYTDLTDELIKAFKDNLNKAVEAAGEKFGFKQTDVLSALSGSPDKPLDPWNLPSPNPSKPQAQNLEISQKSKRLDAIKDLVSEKHLEEFKNEEGEIFYKHRSNPLDIYRKDNDNFLRQESRMGRQDMKIDPVKLLEAQKEPAIDSSRGTMIDKGR